MTDRSDFCRTAPRGGDARWRLILLLLPVLAGGCEVSGPDDVEGVAQVVFSEEMPAFEQVGRSTLRWNLAFSTGACCLTESLVQRRIAGDTVTILPRFRHRPCPQRCLAYVTDSGTELFPGASAVRFRIIGRDEERRLMVAFDTTVALDNGRTR